MAMNPVLGFISIYQINKTFKTFMSQITGIAISRNRRMAQNNINPASFSNFPLQLFYTAVHLAFTILMRPTILKKAST